MQQDLNWYDESVRPFLEKHAKDRLPSLEDDYKRIKRLRALPKDVTVCFLGNSGIGKSTLLNALAADDGQVLPSGGVGPLTAQATEVRYADGHSFQVFYHPRKNLWRTVFVLETRLSRAQRVAPEQESELAGQLDERSRAEAIADAQTPDANAGDPPSDRFDGYVKQARQLVTGNQFSDRSIPYLVDALRLACDNKPKWSQEIDPADMARIERIRSVLKCAEDDQPYERRMGADSRAFKDDLKDHAAGFLSPLIQSIVVGWPAETLKSGVVLVDLPGVGIASDAYRDVTQKYVREKARAIILVVDRAGPTEASLELLRSSGYWDRLVGAADDPNSDPCSMLVVVTKVDDVAAEEWRNLAPPDGERRPAKGTLYARLVEEFKPRIRSQITEQLGQIGASENQAVTDAREQARRGILDGLQIHPVSAPEFRKLLLDDEDDRPFLKDVKHTGIPALRESLTTLAAREREIRQQQLTEVHDRFFSSLLNELRFIEAQWKTETRAAEEAEKLEAALTEVLGPKKREYDRRLGEFRGFLNETVPALIDGLVSEARIVAQTEVGRYLGSLRSMHWATLRAAVRRGGVWDGARVINLPGDIVQRFQEPMAAVWGQKLLSAIRLKTHGLSADIAAMVGEICEWADGTARDQVSRPVLDAQRASVAGRSEQMKQVGKEAIAELREVIKARLADAIRQPIQSACEQFVRSGDDIGPGVTLRILSLFSGLAEKATEAAKKPAVDILQGNFREVRQEIQASFEQWGDPLQQTADLIVERHEQRVKRSDAQKRGRILAELDLVIKRRPVPGNA